MAHIDDLIPFIIKDRLKNEIKILFQEEIKACNRDEKNILYFLRLIKDNAKLKNDCNSVISYVIGITDEKPNIKKLPYSLIRDEPDIDIDFQDTYRDKVIKYIEKTYGSDKVKTISNITTYKPKSAIGNFAKALRIPEWEVESTKDSIIERAGGDNRASFCIEDTFTETDAGIELIKKYPNIGLVSKIEGHANNKGKHAAGVIVSNKPLINYCGINERDGTVHLNKNDAEDLGLLKIDILGLRTLSVLESTARLAGFKYEDFYKIDLEDEKIYEIFQQERLAGIFQYEGATMQSLNKDAPMTCFEDIACAGALARPGALASGGTQKYIDIKNGRREPVYYCDSHKKITENTFGITVFQEQMMFVCRRISGFSWKDVSILRRAASKSYGDEFFDKFRKPFIEGCMKTSNLDEEIATKLWKDVASSGSYSFNRCLSGDTELVLPNPNKYTGKHVTLDWYYKKYVSEIKPALSNKLLNGYRPSLISLYPDKKCRPQKIVAIYKNGIRNCYRYTFDNGSTVECTSNHKFIINGEWANIGINENINNEFVIGRYEKLSYNNGKGKGHNKGNHRNGKGWGSEEENASFINGKTKIVRDCQKIARMEGVTCEDCKEKHIRLECHHNDFANGTKEPGNLSILCPSCHKKRHFKVGRTKAWGKGFSIDYTTLVSVELIGEKMTYDIEMEEHHNFMLKGGIITHNSHSVAYGIISAWCAWAKAYHPIEFIASILNHSKTDKDSLKTLREFYETENLEYDDVDPDFSQVKWSIQNNRLVGGLTNIKGFGVRKAQDAIKMRKGEKPFTPAILSTMFDPETPFRLLYPCDFHWYDIYDNPADYTDSTSEISLIKDVQSKGEYWLIGQILYFDDIKLNDYVHVQKRGYEFEEEFSKKVHFKLEDDTDVITIIISRFNYKRLSQEILTSKLDKTWFIVKGEIIFDHARIFMAKEIANLNEQVGLQVYDKKFSKIKRSK